MKMSKECLEALGENIRYKKEYIGNDTYRLYIKKNEIELLENYLTELEQIKNSNPSEALECVDYIKKKLEGLRYECERTNNHRCDDLFIQEHVFTVIEQALLKSQEQKKENARLKEILINGFRDKNGVFHEQTYLAFIDDEWCICDLKTDEWFLVKEVLI